MARIQFQVLDNSDRSALDQATHTLLEETGVDVYSKSTRDLLADAGAVVDAKGPRVRIPDNLLDHFLRQAPRRVVLASRDGGHDLTLPDGRSHVTTDGSAVTVLDFDTGLRRPSRAGDVADLARVADALDVVDVQWPMVVAGDVPRERHGLAEAAIVFESTTKHVEHEAMSAAEAKTLVEMASAVAGGPEELRKRPVLSCVQCPVSPLMFEEGSTEALVVLARAGVPVVPISMVLMGGSCPVDTAGALLVGNAESLAALCVAQAAAPGAPVILSLSSGPIDMRTGSFSSGSPEAALLSAAGVEMARYYHLPCLTGGLACDAPDPGTQAGVEKLATGLIPMLAGSDLIAGIGTLETDSVASLEQLVIDAEIVQYARRATAPIPVDPETLHLDLVSRLGPGGNFLKEIHTARNFRKALWMPELFVRDGYVEGERAEERTRQRARARALELRKGRAVEPLAEDVRERLWALAGLEPVIPP